MDYINRPIITNSLRLQLSSALLISFIHENFPSLCSPHISLILVRQKPSLKIRHRPFAYPKTPGTAVRHVPQHLPVTPRGERVGRGGGFDFGAHDRDLQAWDLGGWDGRV